MRPLFDRTTRPALVLGAIALLITLTAASCEDAPDVGLADVGRSTVSELVDAPASVTARAAVTLTAPADGTLARLAVTPGQQVAKGQVLAVVDSPAARTRLRQAKQALDAAKRSGGAPRVDLSAARRKLDKAARDAFDQARTAAEQIADPAVRDALLTHITAAETGYRQASAGVASAADAVQRGVASLGSAMQALGSAQKLQAQQAYDLAKATVTALTLRAPLAGVVQLGGTSSAAAGAPDLSSLLGGMGAGVPTGAAGPVAAPAGVASAPAVGAPITTGTAVVTVVDTSELGVVAEVDETDILLVRTGIGADVELDAAPGVRYPATVGAIDVLPTPNSRGAVAYRVHLTLQVPADAPAPRPGMSAVARLQVRQAADAVAVPAAAVFACDGKDCVWVRDAAGRAQRRPVVIGASGADTLQVTEGLTGGERIVVRGVDLVAEGDELP
ncbi:efflux RND transporter periplasmic adaptor subunit [Catellatospora sp. NPDC049609]|uniref:efflux RND transporter periplasmic adaptor subunit n=1 Tax=Catellatospora sp. NPDC049609 TaxID=3155505 RepID=UPI00344A5E14